MDPQVSRVLADAILRPLLNMFDGSWWLGKVPKDWMRANVTHYQKRHLGGLGKAQASQPHFDPQEVGGVAIPGKHCQAHEGGQKM